jgi:hypothetical protein
MLAWSVRTDCGLQVFESAVFHEFLIFAQTTDLPVRREVHSTRRGYFRLCDSCVLNKTLILEAFSEGERLPTAFYSFGVSVS